MDVPAVPARASTLGELVRANLVRWAVPALPENLVAKYEGVAAAAAGADSDSELLAKAVIVAALIEGCAQLQRLDSEGTCDRGDLLWGDLFLSTAGRVAPRLNRLDLEAGFSQALMATALGGDCAPLLATEVARAAKPGPAGLEELSSPTARSTPGPAWSDGSEPDRGRGPQWDLFTVELALATAARLQILDLTDRLRRLVAQFGMAEGRVHVFPRHTTMGVFINENEPMLGRDLEQLLERLVPSTASYQHDDIDRRRAVGADERVNGAAHCRHVLLAPEVMIPVVGGDLGLGRWQSVLLAELDGPRQRRLLVQLEGLSRTAAAAHDSAGAGLEATMLRLWNQDPAAVRLPFGSMLTAGGKRIRPRLAMLASQLGPRHDDERARTLGAVVEFIHNASLIHDDVVDGSAMRRGVPTVHTAYDTETATRVGVFYFARAYGLLAGLRCPRATRLLMEAVGSLGEGELIEYGLRGRRIAEARYLQVVAKKTAALTAGVCGAGAALALAPAATISALTSYGRALGVAFQIVDDVLDFSSTSAKTVGLDLQQSVMSLPLIYAAADGRIGSRVLELLGRPDAGATEEIVGLVRESAALQLALARARDFRDLALEALQPIPRARAVDELRELAALVVERDS